MILEYLWPSHVIRFLCASKRTLLYANEFCRRNPHYFYGCSDAVGSVADTRKLVIALAMEFSRFNYRELHSRYEIVSRVAEIARLVPLVDKDWTPERTLNPSAPLQFVGHQFGLHETILHIPDYIETVDIYSIFLNGHYYVCGIGFQSKTAYSFCGKQTRLLRRSSVLNDDLDNIGYAVDALGVRCLRWGTCQGLTEGPDSARCWEGFSRRQGRR